MAIWEYKVITSGKGGFASPALLEKFLNDLGKEEWDILHFQTQPDNPLAFTGVARRTTQRDWTLEDAAAAAARTEADKLRAEFEAKFKGVGSATAAGAGGAGDDEKPATLASEKAASEDGFRRVRDTERDLDPDAPDEEAKDEWDMLTSEDELPTFFDAIRPHMRRNQRGPGMSVGVEHLAKKWDFSEEDVKGALLECGFAIPEDEDADPVYIEYEGDLYWLNVNRRGELWLNTKEKPRKVFRTVQGQRVSPEAAPEGEALPASQGGEEGHQASNGGNRPEREKSRERQQHQPADDKPAEPLPTGPAILEKIRPLMRRNRRGPGGSGSASFLSRALKCSEAELMTAFAAIGLNLPASGAKPVEVEFGREIWWLNQDQRGGVWINGQEKREGGPAPADGAPSAGDAAAPVKAADLPLSTEPQPSSPSSSGSASAAGEPSAAPAPNPGNIFAAVRLLLKETKTGAVAGKLERVAEELGKSPDDAIATLVAAGLVVPEKPREKPVFVEHAGEIFWFNRNAKDELWLNAKASKYADADGEKKPARRPRAAKKSE
jgi:hypothetical protein